MPGAVGASVVEVAGVLGFSVLAVDEAAAVPELAVAGELGFSVLTVAGALGVSVLPVDGEVAFCVLPMLLGAVGVMTIIDVSLIVWV